MFRPVIMFRSFVEASEPGASRTASLTLVASSAMNSYDIGKNELFDVDLLHRSSSFRFVLSTTAA